MKNQKGFGTLLAVLIIGLVIVAIVGVFILGKYVKSGPVVTNSPSTIPSSSVVNTPNTNLAHFQDLLTQKCRTILEDNVSFNAVNIDDLPLNFDQSVLKIKFTEPGVLGCILDYQPMHAYVDLPVDDGTTYGTRLNIYDSSSNEPGHDGPPFFGPFTKRLTKVGDIEYSLEVGGGNGGTIVGQAPVEIRGEKTIHLSNGDIIFVDMSEIAIPGNDPRLPAILNKYATPSSVEPGEMDVTKNGLEDEIASKFFVDFNNLASPEKDEVAKISKFLNAISPK